ncbi:MAG TPA: hypothetical protein DD001_05405, partial [Microcoleaceae bacterium UBA10368]|nr:hypothetical protein [Microcoleaceae cyanobacterium UBA10368]
MKLSYRGSNYDYDIPTVDMIEGEVAGKYRGHNWNYRYPRHLRGSQQAQDWQQRDRDRLKHTNRSPKADEDVAAVRSALTVEDIVKVHRANICNILDRRLQAAKARG